YGFHGLSYEYIASVLPGIDVQAASGRTVVAHLGNGASLCALKGGQSVACTMGFTPVDGLPMGTRCGALDPGVLLYLMDRHGMDARALEQLIYHQSGLLGVSGISSDMRSLLASPETRAWRSCRRRRSASVTPWSATWSRTTNTSAELLPSRRSRSARGRAASSPR